VFPTYDKVEVLIGIFAIFCILVATPVGFTVWYVVETVSDTVSKFMRRPSPAIASAQNVATV
jgi:hypothetical protein